MDPGIFLPEASPSVWLWQEPGLGVRLAAGVEQHRPGVLLASVGYFIYFVLTSLTKNGAETGCPGNHYVDQPGLEFTEIHLPLSPMCCGVLAVKVAGLRPFVPTPQHPSTDALKLP